LHRIVKKFLGKRTLLAEEYRGLRLNGTSSKYPKQKRPRGVADEKMPAKAAHAWSLNAFGIRQVPSVSVSL